MRSSPPLFRDVSRIHRRPLPGRQQRGRWLARVDEMGAITLIPKVPTSALSRELLGAESVTKVSALRNPCVHRLVPWEEPRALLEDSGDGGGAQQCSLVKRSAARRERERERGRGDRPKIPSSSKDQRRDASSEWMAGWFFLTKRMASNRWTVEKGGSVREGTKLMHPSPRKRGFKADTGDKKFCQNCG